MFKMGSLELYLDKTEVIKKIIESIEKDKININTDDYINNPKYNKYRYKYISMGKIGYVTYDYILEKYYLSQERINKIKGIYGLGTKINLKKKLKNSDLYEEILKEENEKINNIEYQKISCMDDIRQKIEGRPSGLIYKLKNKLDFRIDEFNEQHNKLKLLKFLYDLEKNNINKNKVNIIGILSKPSLENVDNNMVGMTNSHGEILLYIKNEIMKEVSEEFISESKFLIKTIVSRWQQVLNQMLHDIILFNGPNIQKKYNSIYKKIIDIVNNFPKIKELKIDYEHGLFETFYLKLLQHENISRELEFIRIHNYILKKEIILDQKQINGFKTICYCIINIKDIKSYIDTNIDFLSKMVYLKEDVTSKEKQKLKYYEDYIFVLIKWLEKHSSTKFNGKVPLTVIIACFQEIIEAANKKENFECKYYNAKVQNKTLTSILKQGDSSEEVFQILWINKVKYRNLINLGMEKEAKIVVKMCNEIDTLILFILEYPGLRYMMSAHAILLDKIDKLIVGRNYIYSELIKFEDEIEKQTKYKVEIINEEVEIFIINIMNTRICNEFINGIVNIIMEADNNILSIETKKMEFERYYDFRNKNRKDIVTLVFILNTIEKSIEFKECSIVLDEKEQRIREKMRYEK